MKKFTGNTFRGLKVLMMRGNQLGFLY